MAVTTGTKSGGPALKGRKSGPASPPAAAPVSSEVSFAPPPKLRRRPVLVALSVAAICLGALLAAWAYTSTSSAREVVAVRSTVQRGQVIQRSDLVAVRVGVDPALSPIAAGEMSSLVGRRAATDLPAGGLVTSGSVVSSVVPARAMSVVGVALPPSLLPGELLLVGDRVRVVATPGQQGEVSAGAQRFIAATVVSVHAGTADGLTVVSVQVPYAQAAELAARSATGKVALVLDSRER